MKYKPAVSAGAENIRAGARQWASRMAIAPAWLAWAIAGVCLTLVVLALILQLLNGSSAKPNVPIGPGLVAMAVMFPLAGAFIVARQPQNAIGWILCAMGFSEALSTFAPRYAIYTLVTQPGALPGGALMSWIGFWSWLPGFGLIAFLLLLFPNGHLFSPRWR